MSLPNYRFPPLLYAVFYLKILSMSSDLFTLRPSTLCKRTLQIVLNWGSGFRTMENLLKYLLTLALNPI